MLSFKRNQLFELITSQEKWFKGHDGAPDYCDSNKAGVLKHRHKAGTLSQEAYDDLFFHFGYKKELTYTKS